MLNRFTRDAFQLSFPPALLTAAFLLIAPITGAQETAPTQIANKEIAVTKPTAVVNPSRESERPIIKPVYTGYKTIGIGMSADEVRRNLDHLKEKSKQQDYFVFSNKESAQVYYDKAGKVKAISITYIDEKSGAPTPKEVIGQEIQSKPDGSMYQIVEYPAAGYWVAYSRTAGDKPVISVTMQKMRKSKK